MIGSEARNAKRGLRIAACCTALSALTLNASPIDDALLDAIAFVETGNQNIPGDGGEAIGVYQLHASACADAGSRHRDVWDRRTGRETARVYLGQLHAVLLRALKREPSCGELYAAYNCGPSKFIRRGCALARCPRITRVRAAIVTTLVLDRQYQSLMKRTAALRGVPLPNSHKTYAKNK